MWFCNLHVFFLFSMHLWFCGSFSGTGWMLKLPYVFLWHYKKKKKMLIKPITLCWESREKQSPTSVFSRSDSNIQLFVLRFFGVHHLWNLLLIAPILCFGFFGLEACGVLVPWPGIEPAPPALEVEVLTTGLPGKSQYSISSPHPHLHLWWNQTDREFFLALEI